MPSSFSPAQVEQLRRDAKRLARQESIPLHESQHRLAQAMGFQNWSLLVKGAGTIAIPIKRLAPATRRYYLHGDRYELDQTRYYCAECDVFFDPAHFDEKHRVDHGERALKAIERFERAPDDFASNVHRPANAPTILAMAIATARAARDAREAARSPFHRWLDQVKDREDPVGDLAYDILRDKHFPIGIATLPAIRGYLRKYLASKAVLAALKEAWREFEAATQGTAGQRGQETRQRTST